MKARSWYSSTRSRTLRRTSSMTAMSSGAVTNLSILSASSPLIVSENFLGSGTPLSTENSTGSLKTVKLGPRQWSDITLSPSLKRSWPWSKFPKAFLRYTLVTFCRHSWLNCNRSLPMLLTTSHAAMALRRSRSPPASADGCAAYWARLSSRTMSSFTSGMTKTLIVCPRVIPRIRKAPWE